MTELRTLYWADLAALSCSYSVLSNRGNVGRRWGDVAINSEWHRYRSTTVLKGQVIVMWQPLQLPDLHILGQATTSISADCAEQGPSDATLLLINIKWKSGFFSSRDQYTAQEVKPPLCYLGKTSGKKFWLGCSGAPCDLQHYFQIGENSAPDSIGSF